MLLTSPTNEASTCDAPFDSGTVMASRNPAGELLSHPSVSQSHQSKILSKATLAITLSCLPVSEHIHYTYMKSSLPGKENEILRILGILHTKPEKLILTVKRNQPHFSFPFDIHRPSFLALLTFAGGIRFLDKGVDIKKLDYDPRCYLFD